MKNRKLAIISILLAATFAGLTGVFSKFALQTIPPIVLAFFRFFLGSLFITPFLYRERKILIKPSGFVLFLTLLMVINPIVYTFGVGLTTVTISQTLFSAVPLLTAFFSFLFLKEIIHKQKFIGIIIGFIGTLIIIVLPVFGKSAFSGNFTGNVLVTISAFCLAIYSVQTKKIHQQYSPLYLTALFIYATAFIAGILSIPQFISHPALLIHTPLLGWIGTLYIGTFGILFFLLYQYAIKYGSPIIASTTNYLSPAVAFLSSSIFLGERLTLGFLIGVMFTLAGVYMVTIGKFSFPKFKNQS